MRGSHGLSARRAWRTKSSRPEGPRAGPKGRQLEVGPRRGPRLLVLIIIVLMTNADYFDDKCKLFWWQIEIKKTMTNTCVRLRPNMELVIWQFARESVCFCSERHVAEWQYIVSNPIMPPPLLFHVSFSVFDNVTILHLVGFYQGQVLSEIVFTWPN